MIKKDINWLMKEHKKLNRERIFAFWATNLSAITLVAGVPLMVTFDVDKDFAGIIGVFINIMSIGTMLHYGSKNDSLARRQENFEKKHGIKED